MAPALSRLNPWWKPAGFGAWEGSGLQTACQKNKNPTQNIQKKVTINGFFGFYTKNLKYLIPCWLQHFCCFLFWSISRSSIPPKCSGQGLTGPFPLALLQWQIHIWGQQRTPVWPGSLHEDISVLYKAGKHRWGRNMPTPFFQFKSKQDSEKGNVLTNSRQFEESPDAATLNNLFFYALHTKTWYRAKPQIASLGPGFSLNSLSM